MATDEMGGAFDTSDAASLFDLLNTNMPWPLRVLTLLPLHWKHQVLMQCLESWFRRLGTLQLAARTAGLLARLRRRSFNLGHWAIYDFRRRVQAARAVAACQPDYRQHRIDRVNLPS